MVARCTIGTSKGTDYVFQPQHQSVPGSVETFAQVLKTDANAIVAILEPRTRQKTVRACFSVE